jgi:hypothetical protein
MSEDVINRLKGRMAETLVELIFANSNYHVFNCGAPWKFRTLAMLRGDEKPHESTKMEGTVYRRTDEPDFAICPKHALEPKEFIEVKFRMGVILKNEQDKDIKETCAFWTKEAPDVPLSVVVVNCTQRPYFRVLRSPYVDSNNMFLPLVPFMESGWNINPVFYAEVENLISPGVFQGVCYGRSPLGLREEGPDYEV